MAFSIVTSWQRDSKFFQECAFELYRLIQNYAYQVGLKSDIL